MRFRTGASITLAAALFLTGCSSNSGTQLDDIEFTEENGIISADLDSPIEADKPQFRLITEGDGEPVKAGDTIFVEMAELDPETGESVMAEPFGSMMALDEILEDQIPDLYEGVLDTPLGSTIAFYYPADEADDADMPAAEDALTTFKLVELVPEKAEGKEIDESELDPDLPEVTRDPDTGKPEIAEPEGKAPKDLKTDVLIQGDGPKLTENSELTVQYRGIKWSDGEDFDSSWDRGQPAVFPLSGVVEGWQQGLKGQRVGSQVMVVVPPELGYGDADGHELQDETMIFVVDILYATNTED